MGEQKNSFSSLQKSELVLALLASPIIPLMGTDFSLYPIVDTKRLAVFTLLLIQRDWYGVNVLPKAGKAILILLPGMLETMNQEQV